MKLMRFVKPESQPFPVNDLLRQGKNVERANGEVLCNPMVPEIVSKFGEREVVAWPADVPDVND
jgi:hypothetical protein